MTSKVADTLYTASKSGMYPLSVLFEVKPTRNELLRVRHDAYSRDEQMSESEVHEVQGDPDESMGCGMRFRFDMSEAFIQTSATSKTESKSQMKGFLPVCVNLWIFKALAQVQRKLQPLTWQECGFAPLCFNLWVFK